MVIWMITKIALVAGSVWLTRELGVWDSPERTALIFHNFKCHVKPYTEHLKKRYCKISEESTRPWREAWINAWNDSIKMSFGELSRVPQYCTSFSEDLQKSINHIFK